MASRLKARPVCIGDYAVFLVNAARKSQMPATWTRLASKDESNPIEDETENFISSLAIKTVYGPIRYIGFFKYKED